MFDATIDHIEAGRVTRYRLLCDSVALRFADVLTLWHSDSTFCNYYTALLAESPFDAYRWETPPLTAATVNQPFEFVLLNSPGFCSRKTDRHTYGSYFTTDDTDHGVVSFANLSGDATLVVPSPRADISAYGHLAAFIRNAPKEQIEAFWRVLSNRVKSNLGQTPVWLSTAGGGVAWLHVRLDSRPKYYGFAPYRTA
ncbi:MAG: hypothetical protein R3C01_13135 [Planctomycetaceae bacterium]